MGLGPPVCRACKLIMAFDATRKRWACSKCGTSGHGPGVAHLMCLSSEEFAAVVRTSEADANKEKPDGTVG